MAEGTRSGGGELTEPGPRNRSILASEQRLEADKQPLSRDWRASGPDLPKKSAQPGGTP